MSSITSLPPAFIFRDEPATFSIRFVNTEVAALTCPNEPVEVAEPLTFPVISIDPVVWESDVTTCFLLTQLSEIQNHC